VLAARTTERPPAEPRALQGLPRPRTSGSGVPPARRGWLFRLLAGFRDSCALAAVALLGCLAVVAVGTIGSLLWMFLLER
jgi:hypothetical protein